MARKMCTGCGVVKPLADFTKSKLGYLGRHSKCRACALARIKRPKPAALPLGDMPKRCAGCKHTKPLSEFCPSKYARDGRTSRCKPCFNRQRKSKRPDERRRAAEKKGRTYRTAKQRAASAAERKLYRSAEREAIQAWRWWLREGASGTWCASYWSSHPKPWLNPRLTAAERERLRRAVDVDYQIARRLAERQKKLRRQGRLQWCILRALKGGGASPTVETELGYTIAQLRAHIERQFTRGMSWAKFLNGEIHIDHRVATVEFDLSKPDEVRACFAITNLQPMWARDNIQKGAVRHVLL